MGLVTGLLILPLAPVRGVTWMTGRLAEHAANEYYDPARIHADLRELAADLDAGRIDQAGFERAEEALLDRLEEAEARLGRRPETTSTFHTPLTGRDR